MSDDMMRVVSTDGVVDVDVADEGERSLVGSHYAAVRGYLDTGRTDRLADFEGRIVVGVDPQTGEVDPYELEVDPDALDDREAEGDLDIDHIYPNRRW